MRAGRDAERRGRRQLCRYQLERAWHFSHRWLLPARSAPHWQCRPGRLILRGVCTVISSCPRSGSGRLGSAHGGAGQAAGQRAGAGAGPAGQAHVPFLGADADQQEDQQREHPGADDEHGGEQGHEQDGHGHAAPVRRRRPRFGDSDDAVGDRAAEPRSPGKPRNPRYDLEDVGDAVNLGALVLLAAGRVDRQARGDAELRHRQPGCASRNSARARSPAVLPPGPSCRWCWWYLTSASLPPVANRRHTCYGLLSFGRGWFRFACGIAKRPASLGAGSGARRDAHVGRRSRELGCGRSGCQ